LSDPGIRIGIRREDKNEWERRAPLTPDHVAELVRHHGLAVTVESCPRRIFGDAEYARAGARIAEHTDDCHVVFGIKEIPRERIRPGVTYLLFSHTAKAQAHNMPMLGAFLERRATLVDYELIVDSSGRRLVFFGRHAGYAGMIDALWALGRSFAADGQHTPFEQVRLAHEYASLDEATHHVSRIGEQIRHDGIAEPLRPIVCGFTGSGNVTHGALEIFERLPTVELSPDELEPALADPALSHHAVYGVRFRRDHRCGGLARWLPHLTVLVHGAYWSPDQPPIVTRDDLRALWAGPRPRLRLLADLACDLDGALASTVRIADPGAPVYVYDPTTHAARPPFRGPGPLVLAIDNLPCQLPAEASQHFGDALVRFLPALARCDFRGDVTQLVLPPEIVRAIVAHAGALLPRHAWLAAHVPPPC
jgi:saccharopine dehydrogenase (NAD+, L-lysine forming)